MTSASAIPLFDTTEYGTVSGPALVIALPHTNTGVLYIDGKPVRLEIAAQIAFAITSYLRSKGAA